MNAHSPVDAVVLVLTTEANRELAEALAERLLERHLVACVSLFPVTSRYRWQGRMERVEEVQLLLKTSGERWGDLQAALHQLHSYDTPEWIHWTASTTAGYGDWCLQQLADWQEEPL